MGTLNIIIPHENNPFILIYFFLQREAEKVYVDTTKYYKE